MAVAAVACRHRLGGVQNRVGHTGNPIATRLSWLAVRSGRKRGSFGKMELVHSYGRRRVPLRSVTRVATQCDLRVAYV